MANKPTQAQVKARTEQVRQWLLDGYSRADVLRLSAKKWKIAPRTVDDYLKRAHDLFEAERDDAAFRRRIAMRMDLYRRAREAGQLKTAHQILQDLDDLDGRYKRDHEPTDGPVTIVFRESRGKDG